MGPPLKVGVVHGFSTPQSRLPRLDVPLRRPPRLEYWIPGVLDQQLWWQKKEIKIMLEVCHVVQPTNKQQLKTNLDLPPPRSLDAPLLRPSRLEYWIPGVLDQQLWWQKKKKQNHVRGL